MTSGFGTVPDELRQAAGQIGGVIREAADLVWQGPSGDYGHAGVQQGWGQFIDDMKKSVQNLHDKADDHGIDLKGAASAYEEQDSGVGRLVGGIGELVDSAGSSGFVNPAVTKGLGGAVGSIASRLDGDGPEGALY
ncbi:hypothetical protein HFP15_26660 [Amycolatopsis sp. K13G38]|uniref:WXG100 family type VII secretion target n=1 Tax=Amycolatopsis acididurans TaxID=2724524 RepID=A0ABX1JAD3_9PSEU|nr:hypothetical protein [Amycolatopsis acididurans]NKQ56464.1 hypothetical protein [Amycolatopsis acididurans]